MDGESHSHRMDEQEVLETEIRILRERHRDLDERIIALEQDLAPDMMTIRELKRRKLRLKDQIADLEDRLFPDIIA